MLFSLVCRYWGPILSIEVLASDILAFHPLLLWSHVKCFPVLLPIIYTLHPCGWHRTGNSPYEGNSKQLLNWSLLDNWNHKSVKNTLKAVLWNNVTRYFSSNHSEMWHITHPWLRSFSVLSNHKRTATALPSRHCVKISSITAAAPVLC